MIEAVVVHPSYPTLNNMYHPNLWLTLFAGVHGRRGKLRFSSVWAPLLMRRVRLLLGEMPGVSQSRHAKDQDLQHA